MSRLRSPLAIVLLGTLLAWGSAGRVFAEEQGSPVQAGAVKYGQFVTVKPGELTGIVLYPDGKTPAANVAVRVWDVQGRYVLNLDVDCIVHEDMLAEAVGFLDRRPDVGCAGGQLLRRDGSIQHSCRTFYSLPVILMRRTPLWRFWPDSGIERAHLMADWDHQSERPVDWVGGGFMVIRPEAMLQVGLLDEDYAYGFEDVDYAYRMWLAGWQVYYCPSARVVHFENRPSFGLNRLALQHFKSGLKFWWKHHRTLGLHPRYRSR